MTEQIQDEGSKWSTQHKSSIHCQSPLMKCQRAACIPDCVDWICCLMPLCILWEKLLIVRENSSLDSWTIGCILVFRNTYLYWCMANALNLLIVIQHFSSEATSFFSVSVSFCCLIQKRVFFLLFWCGECQVVWKNKVWHTYRNMHVLKASVAAVPFVSSP